MFHLHLGRVCECSVQKACTVPWIRNVLKWMRSVMSGWCVCVCVCACVCVPERLFSLYHVRHNIIHHEDDHFHFLTKMQKFSVKASSVSSAAAETLKHSCGFTSVWRWRRWRTCDFKVGIRRSVVHGADRLRQEVTQQNSIMHPINKTPIKHKVRIINNKLQP